MAAADRESHEGNPARRLNGSCPKFPSGPLQLPKKLLPIDLCGEATLTAQKPVGASTTNQTAGGPASSEKSLPQQRPDPPKRFVALQRQLHRGAPATPNERALYQTRAISKRRPNIVACNLVHLLNFQCINPRFLGRGWHPLVYTVTQASWTDGALLAILESGARFPLKMSPRENENDGARFAYWLAAFLSCYYYFTDLPSLLRLPATYHLIISRICR